MLETKNLSLGFAAPGGSSPLFENLNLSLRAGELVCLMGPNGVGKSTFIRTLAGLQKPLSGEVIGQGNQKNQPRNIAVVLTDKVANPNMTVRDLISYGRYPYLDWTLRHGADDRTAIDTAIQQTQIEHLSHKKLDELSDGQRQMAMIARALAQETPLLLLDEPTAHLDLNNRLEIMNLLRKIARAEGKAILIATHELDLALQTADAIWLATRNKTICAGLPEDLILDGSFDEVFQFKGYDLKTGKVDHDAHRGIAVRITGDGPEYLWTKNALERNGFEISDSAPNQITLTQNDGVAWIFSGHAYRSLGSLVNALNKLHPTAA